MTMFTSFGEMLGKGDQLTLTIRRLSEGRLTVLVQPGTKREVKLVGDSEYGVSTEKITLKPMAVTGTAEELNAEFLTALQNYNEANATFLSSVDALAEENQARLDALKAKSEAKKAGNKKASGNANTEVSRKGGEIDEDGLDKLVRTPESDKNFKSALGQANEATLREALARVETLSAMRSIAQEIKRISGEELSNLLTPVLIETYKATTDPKAKDTLGKAVCNYSGKSLADLGLAPKQTSLLGDF